MGRQWKQKFWRYKEDYKFYIKHGSVCLKLTQNHSDENLILKSHVMEIHILLLCMRSTISQLVMVRAEDW